MACAGAAAIPSTAQTTRSPRRGARPGHVARRPASYPVESCSTKAVTISLPGSAPFAPGKLHRAPPVRRSDTPFQSATEDAKEPFVGHGVSPAPFPRTLSPGPSTPKRSGKTSPPPSPRVSPHSAPKRSTSAGRAHQPTAISPSEPRECCIVA